MPPNETPISLRPQMLRKVQAQNALLLFGDEASGPTQGTLTYTWARRRQQPIIKTSLPAGAWIKRSNGLHFLE
jgi:hypothetical protein